VRRRTLVLLVLAAALVVLISAQALVRLVADWYWFQDLDLKTVFLTELGTKLALGLGVGLVAFGFFYLNLRIAQRGIVPDPVVMSVHRNAPIELTRLLRRMAWPVAAFVALIMALSAANGWLLLLRFLHRTPFGEADPVFGKDIAYYLFTLPVAAAALQFLVGLTVLSLLMVVPLYVLRRDVLFQRRRVVIEPSAEIHLAVLLALLFAATVANVFLVRIPSLLYSTAGPLFGASYVDLAIRVPVLRVLGGIAFVGLLLVLLGARTHRLLRNAVVAIALYALVALAGAGVAASVQKFVVDPNELIKETPQLAHHIAATRRAWGLDAVSTRDLGGEATLTLADIEANSGTINNVRLWDRDPLLQTFQQLQEIRTYYDFRSVDDDRYWIDGKYRQVLLSARELNVASLPTRNFINEHLSYTHGMGLTLSPVNQVSTEGLPVLFVKDLPPQSTVSLNVTRPALYYGELVSGYAFVNTRQREFDYPQGDSSAFTVYRGTHGVRVNSLFRKTILSMRFGSMDVLLTGLITRDSRVLYHRNIMERAAKALPFLKWDADPYLVITQDGRLVWILDAYTASSRYPYSLPVSGGTNYLRNSVKVVIDAYEGTVRPYVADPNDPILKTYARIFGGIFLPLDSMPPDIRAHLRYPADLFRIQTALYTTYHMDQPDLFYAREDQWQIPGAQGAGADPFLRHMIMRLPDETTEEYISMTPFTPRQKDNLAAWMVARSDGAHYGQLVVYRFPRQSLVFGPTQIANRINQNTEISGQISLWDQRGSEVIRGNLLVIPIGESLLFVQALYLRAEGGKIPELKRVIVAYQNQVVMEETLAQGIARLFGGAPAPEAAGVVEAAGAAGGAEAAATVAPAAGTTAARIAELVREASERWERATAAQRAGDWATYGAEMRRVGELLGQLQGLVPAGRRD
jgi:uncharacterized membrane protein (UPF0182 family)